MMYWVYWTIILGPVHGVAAKACAATRDDGADASDACRGASPRRAGQPREAVRMSGEIHHVERVSVTTDAQWRRVFIDTGMSIIRATAGEVLDLDEVQVLLLGQPSAADNGPWLVRSDGSHRRPSSRGAP